MLHRISALAIGGAALGIAALPQTASAQFYDDAGQRPFVLHTQDDIRIDGDRARVEHSQDLRPGARGFDDGHRRYDGPVVFDERDPYRSRGWRDGHEPEAGYGYRRPIYGDERRVDRYGYRDDGYGHGDSFEHRRYGDDRAGYGTRFEHHYRPIDGTGPYGGAYGEAVPYRSISAPVGPVFERLGGYPDVGCTIEQSQSTTPVGWRKIVTHRVCYRR